MRAAYLLLIYRITISYASHFENYNQKQTIPQMAKSPNLGANASIYIARLLVKIEPILRVAARKIAHHERTDYP